MSKKPITDRFVIGNIIMLFHEWFVAPKQQKRQPYNSSACAIEPKIAALVNAFNTINGVKTIASCQGHCAGHEHPPYVYFSAPTEFCAWLSKQCREETSKDKRYYTPWQVDGVFNENYQLTFCLYSPLYHQHYLRKGWWYLGWHRKRVDNELDYLTDMVKHAKLV